MPTNENTAQHLLAKDLSEFASWVRLFHEQGNVPWDGTTEITREAFAEYCYDFRLQASSFTGLIVIDVGCGPRGTLHCFQARAKFGVDPLANLYMAFGIAAQDMVYVNSPAEHMPFVDDFADVVISRNALDHGESFEDAIAEIHRVLKPNGRALLQFNLSDTPPITDPSVLSEVRVRQALAGWFECEIVRYEHTNRPNVNAEMVIDSRKVSGALSRDRKLAQAVFDSVADSGQTQEEFDLSVARRYGAPRKVLAELHMAVAFQQHQRGDGRAVRRHVLRGILHDPAFLRNRGVISILVRSLLGKWTM